DCETDAAQHRLHERCDDDAERHTSNRLTGKTYDLVAALAREAAAEPTYPAGGILAGHVKNRGDDDGEQELQSHQTEVTDLGDEPARGATRIRPDDFRELFQPLVRVFTPQLRGLLADDRNLLDELGRRRKLHVGEPI